ncbi:MAG: glycerophosphodiester phosphodiesterase family protein [Paludibacteraceae bacterium]
MKRLLLFFFVIGTAVYTSSQTKVIAHRGFWDTENSAQNSLTSLYKASNTGCYGSEFDVQMTADGKLIVFHDNELKGKKIYETPYDSLRNYRLSNGEILPTLEQYLIHARNCPKIKLILEIKTYKDIPLQNIRKIVSETMSLVNFYGLQSRTEYIAFDLSVCKEVRKKDANIPVFYLNGDASPAELKALNITGLNYHYKKITENPTLVTEAHTLGLKLNVWTVNDVKAMNQFIEQGVDFITTDKPLLLIDTLK